MAQPEQAGATGVLAGLSDELAGAVERAAAAVVRVDARRRLSASGIIWEATGLVVTADHVLEREEDITVGLADGRDLAATIVGRDPGTDLALLRVEAQGLAAAAPGPAPRVGHLVLALGRPGPGGPMATAGIVSALGGPARTWRGSRLEGFIRTDAVLYPGFSGGPLVDVTGRVLGLNSSHLAQGMSLAIPVESVARIVAALLQTGRVRRGFLGITSQPVLLPIGLRRRLDLDQETGLLVVGVEPDGPADRGGMLLGDVLVGLAGAPVRDTDDLQRLLTGERIGQPTPVRVIRGGEVRDLTITVGERR
ncbi:MAG: trypsin-like peptidase domain-containing protein [Chloroflexi bacterium]|nr:trypsin-like peptidase domain-containing protein [Chloroflexota bacterium]